MTSVIETHGMTVAYLVELPGGGFEKAIARLRPVDWNVSDTHACELFASKYSDEDASVAVNYAKNAAALLVFRPLRIVEPDIDRAL